MPQRELLRLADLALRGHLSPRLPHEVIRIVAEASRAERGLLLASEETLVAAWPDVAADSAGEATEEPALRSPLGHGSHIWTAGLEHGAAVGAAIVHVNDLPGLAGRIQYLHHAGVQTPECLRLVENWNHRGEVGPARAAGTFPRERLVLKRALLRFC